MKTQSEQSEYLEKCLESYYVQRLGDFVAKFRKKRDEVKQALLDQFGEKLAGQIIMSGSLAKSTEINTKFDVDIIVPFRHDAFTLETMSDEVHQFLKKKFSFWQDFSVRKQRVSVGMEYRMFIEKPVKIDVVPGREIGIGAYKKDRYLNLWDSTSSKRIQTNLHKQLQTVSDIKGNGRKIIKLLKIWKTHGGGPKLKSFLLEQLVLEAFKQSPKPFPIGLAQQLEMTLVFIMNNIASISLRDVGNSNNVVSNLLTATEKRVIAASIREILKDIKSRPKRITNYFPANSKYLKA